MGTLNIFASCLLSVSAIPAQVKVNLYFFTQTGKYEVSRVSDAVFPKHVPLLRGVGNVRNDAGLILPGGSSLEKHLNNNDRKCVWHKVGGMYMYMYVCCMYKGSLQKMSNVTLGGGGGARCFSQKRAFLAF